MIFMFGAGDTCTRLGGRMLSMNAPSRTNGLISDAVFGPVAVTVLLYSAPPMMPPPQPRAREARENTRLLRMPVSRRSQTGTTGKYSLLSPAVYGPLVGGFLALSWYCLGFFLFTHSFKLVTRSERVVAVGGHELRLGKSLRAYFANSSTRYNCVLEVHTGTLVRCVRTP